MTDHDLLVTIACLQVGLILVVTLAIPTIVRLARAAAITEESEARRIIARKLAPPRPVSELVPADATEHGKLDDIDAQRSL